MGDSHCYGDGCVWHGFPQLSSRRWIIFYTIFSLFFLWGFEFAQLTSCHWLIFDGIIYLTHKIFWFFILHFGFVRLFTKERFSFLFLILDLSNYSVVTYFTETLFVLYLDKSEYVLDKCLSIAFLSYKKAFKRTNFPT